MVGRILKLVAFSVLPLAVAPVFADEALDDSYAFEAAKLHNTVGAYRSYLSHCQVCSHRSAAAKRLDGVLGVVVSIPLASVVTANEVVRQASSSALRVSPTLPSSDEVFSERLPVSNEIVVNSDWAEAGSPLSLVTPIQYGKQVKPPKRPAVVSAARTQKPKPPRYFAAGSGATSTQMLKGHSRTVWSVAYDPKGAVLASGSADQKIRLWPLAEGGVSRQLSGHKGYISALDFSADGKFLASVSGDQSVRLWQNGRTTKVLSHAGSEVSAVSFTRDSQRLISGSENSMLHLWDVDSGRLQQSLNDHKSGVLAIDISPFGDEFASSDATGNVLVWKLGKAREKPRRKLRILAHNGMAYDVKYASDGQQLFTAGADGLVNRWHGSGAQAGVLAGHRNGVTSLAVHRNGEWLLSGGRDRSVRVWNLKTGQQAAFYNTQVGEIYSLALSPSGRRLAVSGSGDAVQLIELDLGSNTRS